MLVEYRAFRDVLELAGEGDIEGAVDAFRDKCRHRHQCDHPCLKYCGQCLSGTLLYASLKGQNRIYELTYDRLVNWCSRREENARRKDEMRVAG